jgi:hypothetical protein
MAREYLRDDGRSRRADERTEESRALIPARLTEELRDHLRERRRVVRAERRRETVRHRRWRRGSREPVEVIFHLIRRGLHAGARVLLQETAYLIHPAHLVFNLSTEKKVSASVVSSG